MPHSLRFRFLLAATVSIVLALMATGIVLTSLFHTYFEARTQKELEVYLFLLTKNVGPDANGDIVVTDLSDPRFSQPLSGYYWQVQIGEHDPIVSPSYWSSPMTPQLPETPGEVVFQDVETGIDEVLYTASWVVTFGEGDALTKVFITVAFDHASINIFEERFANRTIAWLTVLGIALIFANWIQVQFGFRPIEKIRAEVGEIKENSASRMTLRYPIEILPLASEINELMDMNDASVKRARESASDLAHGLKTPLTILRAVSQDIRTENTDKSPQELAQEIDIEIENMEHFVERELARVRDSYKPRNRAQVQPIANRLCAALARQPLAENLEWSVDISTELYAPFDEYDLTELLGNIVDNAIRHADSSIKVKGSRDQNTHWICVQDDGDGIPEDHINTVLKRGKRMDTDSSGTGIGLSIVKDMCDRHGCALTIRNLDQGGLEVKISWNSKT